MPTASLRTQKRGKRQREDRGGLDRALGERWVPDVMRWIDREDATSWDTVCEKLAEEGGAWVRDDALGRVKVVNGRIKGVEGEINSTKWNSIVTQFITL